MAFNYEEKIWGNSTVRIDPSYLGALRLTYCLQNLQQTKGKVLEIGCGGGGMIAAVKHYRKDLSCFGCDISKSAIKIAKKTFPKVKFGVGDIYKLPYKNNSFDAVVIFDVLEHIPHIKKALKEIQRVLKKGGVFSVYIPVEGEKSCYIHWVNKLGWNAKEMYAGHIQRLTKKKIVSVLRKIGFTHINWKWSDYLFYQLIDFLYFSILGIRGKNVTSGVEGIVAHKKTVFTRIIGFLTRNIARTAFYESRIFSFLPGMGLHVYAEK